MGIRLLFCAENACLQLVCFLYKSIFPETFLLSEVSKLM